MFLNNNGCEPCNPFARNAVHYTNMTYTMHENTKTATCVLQKIMVHDSITI